eukprot:SAG22_NODE_443_length_10453_cov_8.799691_11_plen_804_part_00
MRPTDLSGCERCSDCLNCSGNTVHIADGWATRSVDPPPLQVEVGKVGSAVALFKCPRKDTCLEGNKTTCRNGSTGPLCGSCTKEYGFSHHLFESSHGKCRQCADPWPTVEAILLSATSILIPLIVGVGCAAKWRWKRRRPADQEATSLYHNASVGKQRSIKFGEDTGLLEHVVILLEFFQILRAFSDAFLLPLPELMSTYHRITQTADVSSVSPEKTFLVMHCWLLRYFKTSDPNWAAVEFYASWFTNVVLVPATIFFLTAQFYAYKFCKGRRKDHAELNSRVEEMQRSIQNAVPGQSLAETGRRDERLTFANLMSALHTEGRDEREHKYAQDFKTAIVFATLLLYPSVSARLFQLFSFRQLGPTEFWLEDDYATPAQDETWKCFAALALFLIALIPIGLPVWLWSEIYSVRCIHAAESKLMEATSSQWMEDLNCASVATLESQGRFDELLNRRIFSLQWASNQEGKEPSERKRRNAVLFAWIMLRPGGHMTDYRRFQPEASDSNHVCPGPGCPDEPKLPGCPSLNSCCVWAQKLANSACGIDGGLFENVKTLEQRGDLARLQETYKVRFDGKGRLDDIAREYKPAHLQAEPIGWFRRMLQSGAIVFLHRGSVFQMVVGICLTAFFAVRHFTTQPYVRPHTNKFKGCLEAQLFLTYLIGLILRLRGVLSGDAQFDTEFFEDLLIYSFVILVPISFVNCTYWNIEQTIEYRLQTPRTLRCLVMPLMIFAGGVSWFAGSKFSGSPSALFTSRFQIVAYLIWVSAIMLCLASRSQEHARRGATEPESLTDAHATEPAPEPWAIGAE